MCTDMAANAAVAGARPEAVSSSGTAAGRAVPVAAAGEMRAWPEVYQSMATWTLVQPCGEYTCASAVYVPPGVTATCSDVAYGPAVAPSGPISSDPWPSPWDQVPE
jgi:hypothetical protein